MPTVTRKVHIKINSIYKVYQFTDGNLENKQARKLPITILLRIMCGEGIPESIPEHIAVIVWSSLLSKHIGKYTHCNTTNKKQKNSNKYLYLYIISSGS